MEGFEGWRQILVWLGSGWCRLNGLKWLLARSAHLPVLIMQRSLGLMLNEVAGLSVSASSRLAILST